jgi:hypothetical protein
VQAARAVQQPHQAEILVQMVRTALYLAGGWLHVSQLAAVVVDLEPRQTLADQVQAVEVQV